jgi:glycosyltransferase involved in cell wall biosynthesis
MTERITVLYPITDLARDGAQRQLLELVKGLDKERFRPAVLALRPGGAMEAEFRDVPGLKLISLRRSGRLDDLACLFRVASIIRKEKVDVIQPFLTPATFCGVLAALLCGTPVKIVTERVSAGRTNTSSGYRLYLKVENILSRCADWAVANSKAGAEFLIQRGINPKRVRVIYNGLNLDRLAAGQAEIEQVRRKLNVPPGGKVVGMMARMFPQKRHDIFLKAAAIVSAEIPETRFALLGDGPLRDSLEDLSRELGIASKVAFLGEQQVIAPYLSAFDVAALISEAEGCSNSILEAMAIGKPVVATDVGGNRELVAQGETGILVSINERTVAEAILSLIKNRAQADALGHGGKNAVAARFGVGTMVTEYQALYEETLKHRARKLTA